MEADLFYQRIVKIAARSPYDRYALLAEFHTELISRYLSLIRSMPPQAAGRIGVDGRTIAQVVGHIAEWERYTILAAGEMIAGVEWPQIMSLSGYQEPDGQIHSFGPFVVGPHSTLTKRFDVPLTYQGTCTFHQKQQMRLVVNPAPWHIFN